MNCAECNDDILLFAAGALDPAEAQPLRKHLAVGCPNCAGKMAEAQATLALLSLSLSPVSPAPDVKRRLMAKIAGDHPLQMPKTAVQPVSPMAISPWSILAIPSAIAAAVAAAITIFFAVRIQNRQVAVAPSPNVEGTLGVLTAYVQQQDHEIAALRSASTAQTVEWAADPHLKMIWLDGTPNQPAGAGGRIFWDTDHGVWHFFASGIKPAPPSKTYELWFVKSDGTPPVAAGPFNAEPDGDAALVTNVPADIANKIVVAAVTDEPAATPATAPTGSFQLKGAVP